MLYSSFCLRLRSSPKSEGGESCGCWNQLNHLILEAHTRSIWVQSLLDPLPGCESRLIIIILKGWPAILMDSFCSSLLFLLQEVTRDPMYCLELQTASLLGNCERVQLTRSRFQPLSATRREPRCWSMHAPVSDQQCRELLM